MWTKTNNDFLNNLQRVKASLPVQNEPEGVMVSSMVLVYRACCTYVDQCVESVFLVYMSMCVHCTIEDTMYTHGHVVFTNLTVLTDILED